jgi:hypothetical protein
MRRRAIVAVSALIAAAALIGLPGPAGTAASPPASGLQAAAFMVPTSSGAPVSSSVAQADGALRADGRLDAATRLIEMGTAPAAPTTRPKVTTPSVTAGVVWKPGRYTLSGWATFYTNGTTAMRIPLGTTVRICGPGGCVLRTVTDYGPQRSDRVVDMYRPDFFAICGCASWSGTVRVTVTVY